MGRDRVRNELLQRRLQRDALRQRAEHRLAPWVFDELLAAWRAAQEQATKAYEHWCRVPGADGCAAYRAAQDRADQAQDALWRQHALQTSPSNTEAWLT
jgi:hypothetical protein